MKLIAVDNFNRESVADVLVAENLSEPWATYLAAAANEHDPGGKFFHAVPDDRRLWGGMSDLTK